MKPSTLLALAVGMAFAVPQAEARVTKVVIDRTLSQSPAFGGYSWPGVGPYEKILGTASGELNPSDPRNALIVDLDLAPRNSNGNVEYSFDFYILKPINLANGAHKVMYEPPNRGGKTWNTFGRVPGGNDPGSITDGPTLANAFLMPRGYTMVWSGWDASAGRNTTKNAASPTTITLPIAHVTPTSDNPTGTITGPSFEYFTGNGTSSLPLTYPPANSLDKTSPQLTHRVHLDDVPAVMPNSSWNYNATGTAITLTSGSFTSNDIYEFSYTAKDPTVNGIGFAAIRDFVAWLRYENRDEQSPPTANPLAGDIQRVYTEVVSQPGRLLNDFRHLGFNEAENGQKVFDGHMQWIAAGDGINMNYRFSQSGRTERNRQNHLYIEGRFPFANVTTDDPITRTTDSRYASCQETKTCPLGVEIYSANEYWVKAASLLHTDPQGTRDLPDSQYTRDYFISSHQHGTGNGTSRGSCQQFQNPLNSAPVQRALWIALDDWATTNSKPPETRVPAFRDGTLVPPLPQSGMGFPTIPGVTYTGLKTTRYLFDYGLNFYETGIATVNPPVITPPYEDNPANGPIYPSFVPKTDSDGNDIAGVRLPDVTVPVATYTGWALRSGPQANDGCESSGQMIAFPRTAADRAATGDPRPSVEERYPTFQAYYSKVVSAIDDLIAQRLYLCEDAQPELNRLVANGLAHGVPAATQPPPAAETFPHCQMSRAGRSDHYK